jgi:hypothetical protein
MIVAIIVLSILLAAATAFIFWLLQVLKNTLDTTDGLVQLLEGKTPRQLKTAYNDKYYPAAVIAKIVFNAPSEGKVVDFSMYEKYKIVGFTILTTESAEAYYGKDFIAELDEEMKEEIYKPVLIKKALVYEVAEGNWLWKSAE